MHLLYPLPYRFQYCRVILAHHFEQPKRLERPEHRLRYVQTVLDHLLPGSHWLCLGNACHSATYSRTKSMFLPSFFCGPSGTFPLNLTDLGVCAYPVVTRDFRRIARSFYGHVYPSSIYGWLRWSERTRYVVLVVLGYLSGRHHAHLFSFLEYIMQSFFNAVLYATTPEMFPAYVRGSACGLASTLGRLSGVSSAFFNLLPKRTESSLPFSDGRLWHPLPHKNTLPTSLPVCCGSPRVVSGLQWLSWCFCLSRPVTDKPSRRGLHRRSLSASFFHHAPTRRFIIYQVHNIKRS